MQSLATRALAALQQWVGVFEVDSELGPCQETLSSDDTGVRRGRPILLVGSGIRPKPNDQKARRKKLKNKKTMKQTEISTSPSSSDETKMPAATTIQATDYAAKENVKTKTNVSHRRKKKGKDGSKSDQERPVEAKDTKVESKLKATSSELKEGAATSEGSVSRKTESDIKKEDEERVKKARGERFVIRVSLSDDVYEHMLDVASGPRGMSPNESVVRADRNRQQALKKKHQPRK